MEATKEKKHFVLVHGACHGAWCWYKLKPLLEASGHRVTAADLAASGINSKSVHEIKYFTDYSKPLIEVMSSVPPEEKVILVGHSLGGLNLGLVMEMFPEKVSVGVFLTAFLPDIVNKPSYVLEQFGERISAEEWMDSKFETYGNPEEPLSSMLFGVDYMKCKLYQLCSIQDFTLATTLVRPIASFVKDLSKLSTFTSDGYGSVKRVYIVCNEDQGMLVTFQRWMIENSGLNEVKEIQGADHMAMLSKPHKLCECLLEIANDCE